jgi:hypothetical protein
LGAQPRPQNLRQFGQTRPRRQKTGQLLVRTPADENAGVFRSAAAYVRSSELWPFNLLLTLRSAPWRASRRVGNRCGGPKNMRTHQLVCSPPFETAAGRPPQGEEQCETAKVSAYEWRAPGGDGVSEPTPRCVPACRPAGPAPSPWRHGRSAGPGSASRDSPGRAAGTWRAASSLAGCRRCRCT